MTGLITNAECILRGNDDQAVRLFVDSFDEELAAVKPTAGKYDRPLCFRRDRIFAVSEELLREIEENRRAGNIERVRETWKHWRLWQPK